MTYSSATADKEREIGMNLLRPGAEVDPGYGPHSLPFTWRVLYELADLYDGLAGVPSPCVLERQVLGSLADELALPPARKHMPWDEYVASVDPTARRRLEGALDALVDDQLVELVDRTGPYAEWRAKPTAPGYHLVHAWRQQWIKQAEQLAAQPRGYRKWLADFFAAQTVALTLGTIAGLVVGAAAAVLIQHYLPH